MEELDYLTTEQFEERQLWLNMERSKTIKIILTVRDVDSDEKRLGVGFVPKKDLGWDEDPGVMYRKLKDIIENKTIIRLKEMV